MMQAADLVITVEDRNMYPRVVGTLPKCRKIAITSNEAMTRKNQYLCSRDIVILGDLPTSFGLLLKHLSAKPHDYSFRKRIALCRRALKSTERPVHQHYTFLRDALPNELGRIMKSVTFPVLVSDSQMFGAVISQRYCHLPLQVRVFGDHGGFVGCGISYGAGVAMGNPEGRVWCLLSDSAFLNGIKGLAVAVEHRLNMVFVICNNGGAVSLQKQLRSDLRIPHEGGLAIPTYLQNAQAIDYCALAAGFGLATFCVNVSGITATANERIHLRSVLNKIMKLSLPSLLEIRAPDSMEAWEGIWETDGFDSR